MTAALDRSPAAEPALRPGARMIYVLSMSGAPGLLWHILHPLTRGLSIFYERGFEPARTLRRLEEEKIQVMAGVPVLFEQMAKRPGSPPPTCPRWSW